MKHFVPFALLAASIISCLLLVLTNTNNSHEIKQYIQMAEEYEKKELYIKAIECYQNAIEVSEDNYEYKMAVIRDYVELDDFDSAINLAKLVIESNPKKEECYYMLLDYYKDKEDYNNYVFLLKRAIENFPQNKMFLNHISEVEKMYEVDSSNFSEITMFFHDRAIACNQFLDDDSKLRKRYTVMEGDGKVKFLKNYYEEVRFTDQMDSYLVVDEKKGLQMIDAEGYPIARNPEVVSGAGIQVEFEGFSSAELGGKYFILNSELERSKDSWDFAGAFSEGVAPVKIENKWAVITPDTISADKSICKYEDIIVDEFGRCCIQNRMFAKLDGKYFMFDKEGKRVTDSSFEDADTFVSEQPAAVKVDGKWGYISSDGEMVIQPEYEEALSFSNGYAAVKKEGKWGVINSNNQLVVSPQFEQVKYMSTCGLIPVKDTSGYWNMLKMYKLYYSKEE